MAHVRGEQSPTAKLSAAAVLAIRAAAATGVPEVLLIRALGEAWGITVNQLRFVITGQSWRHVGGPTRPINQKWIARRGPQNCPLDGIHLEQAVLPGGRVVTFCPGCDRRRAGLCMECGGKVRGKAWRCPAHQYSHHRLLIKECYYRHLIERRRACAAGRRYSNRTHAQIEHDRAVRRAYKAAHPDKELQKRRRQRLKGCGGWATHEQYVAYHAAYREKNRERLHAQQVEIHARKRREREEARRMAIRPKCRVCGCDIPWKVGTKGRPALRCNAHNPYNRGKRRAA